MAALYDTLIIISGVIATGLTVLAFEMERDFVNGRKNKFFKWLRDFIGRQKIDMTPYYTAIKTKPKAIRYQIYKDEEGNWRWRLVAANNRIIANSDVAYHNKQDCLHSISLIKKSTIAPIIEYI